MTALSRALSGAAPQDPRLRWAIAGALGVWVFAFVWLYGTYATTLDPTHRLVAALVYAVPVVGIALACLLTRPHPLDLPLIALVVIYAIVSLLSTDRTASLETLALVIGYASLFVVLVRLGDGPARQGIVVGAAFAATAWLVFCAVRWVADAVSWVALDGSVPPLTARNGFLWLSTDAVAALILVAAPYFLLIQRRSTRRVLGSVALAASAVVIPLSGGRVEWAAMLLAALVYWLLGLPASSHRSLRRAILIGTAAMGILGVAALTTGMLGTLSGRTFIWTTAMAIVQNHPLVGSGPGTFSWVRLAEAPDLLNRYPVYHAHNLLLQLLADGGILLAAAFAGFCVAYARHLAPRVETLMPALRAGIASVVGFGLVLMLDELTQLPALTCLAIGSAAFVARTTTPAGWRSGWPLGRWVAAGLLLALVVISVPAALTAQSARMWADLGRARALSGDWSAANDAFSRAADVWPARASYQLALGLAQAHLGNEVEALSHYRLAHELSPGDPRALGGVGALGDPGERTEALARASRLGTSDPQYAYRLALELKAAGDEEGAAAELGRAVLDDPQLLAVTNLESWGLETAQVVRAVRRALGAEGQLLAVSPVSVENAIALVANGQPQDPIMAALALARRGAIEPAREVVAGVLRDRPQDRDARIVAHALSALACDVEQAEHHQRLLDLLPGGFSALYRPDAPLRETPDHIYREMGLGDYQPPQAGELPILLHEWPNGYLPPSACGGDQ